MFEQLKILWSGDAASPERPVPFTREEALALFGKFVRARNVIRSGVTGPVRVVGKQERGIVSHPVQEDGAWKVCVMFEVDVENPRPAIQAELSSTARIGQKFVTVPSKKEFDLLFEVVGEETPPRRGRESGQRVV